MYSGIGQKMYSGMGQNIRADHVTVQGPGCNVKGDYNIISGAGCNVNGDYNTVSGVGCNVKGDYNRILASAKGCTVNGDYNQVDAVGCTVRGNYNEGNGTTKPTNMHPDWQQLTSTLGNNFIQHAAIGSGMSMSGNASISEQFFDLGARMLTLRNIKVDRFQCNLGAMRFEYGWHTLVYEHQQLKRDGALVNLDALFGLDTAMTLEWAEFQQLLEIVEPAQPAQHTTLEGADEVTDDENKACSVCLANVKVCVVEPCMHLCLCIECAKQIKDKCPLCRAAMTSVKRVYQ